MTSSNASSCRFELAPDVRWLQQEKFHRDRVSPAFPLSDRFIADVKCEQEQAARLQNAAHLAKNHGQRGLRHIHDGVERGDAGECRIRDIQREHVSFAEANIRIQPLRFLDHTWRKVQPEQRGNARVAQIPGDVPGAAAYVANIAAPRDLGGEAIEQLAVERLVSKFIRDALRVIARDVVVAFANPARGCLADLALGRGPTLSFGVHGPRSTFKRTAGVFGPD
jgi:hypothetical protein